MDSKAAAKPVKENKAPRVYVRRVAFSESAEQSDCSQVQSRFKQKSERESGDEASEYAQALEYEDEPHGVLRKAVVA